PLPRISENVIGSAHDTETGPCSGSARGASAASMPVPEDAQAPSARTVASSRGRAARFMAGLHAWAMPRLYAARRAPSPSRRRSVSRGFGGVAVLAGGVEEPGLDPASDL